jgi:hypothetical protein
MTILITSYTSSEIVLVSDLFRYVLKKGVLEDVLNQKLQITHENLKERVERIEKDAPKIHRLTKNVALSCSGDCSFNDIIQNLNARKDVPKQILARLQNKKLEAFWTCHVASFNKKTGKAELTSIIYEKGSLKTKESTQDNITLDSFALETKDLFFKKYGMVFYVGSTEEKTKIIQEFFSEITELFQGDAGGEPIIAKIDKDGFKWIVKPKQSRAQNFTTYAYNWCPEKIETQSTTEVAWSQQTWTTVLELTFECESTMLLLILAHAVGRLYSTEAGHKGFSFRLTLDDTELYDTNMRFIGYHSAANYRQDNYSVHNVAIKTKGSHSLKLQMYTESLNCILYTYGRRLSILKGFYQGGTT